jgi:hypothetical protein
VASATVSNRALKGGRGGDMKERSEEGERRRGRRDVGEGNQVGKERGELQVRYR